MAKITSTVKLADGQEVTIRHPEGWSEQRIKSYALKNRPVAKPVASQDEHFNEIDLMLAGFLDSAEPFIPDVFIFGTSGATERMLEGRDADAIRRENWIRETAGIPLDADLGTYEKTVRAMGDPLSYIGVGKTGATTALGKLAGTTGQLVESVAGTAAAIKTQEATQNLTGVKAIDDIVSQSLGLMAGAGTGVATAPIRATALGGTVKAGEEVLSGINRLRGKETTESVVAKTNAVSSFLAEQQVAKELNDIRKTVAQDPAEVTNAIDNLAEIKDFVPSVQLDGVLGAMSDNPAVRAWAKKTAQRNPEFLNKLKKEAADNLKLVQRKTEEVAGDLTPIKEDSLFNIATKVYEKKLERLDKANAKSLEKFENEMARQVSKLDAESPDVVGAMIKQSVMSRETELRNQVNELYDAATLAGKGLEVPARQVKNISTLAASLRTSDPFGVDSAVGKKLRERWTPNDKGELPVVPVQELVSLKKAINTDLNKQYRLKNTDVAAPQKIDKLQSLKANVQGVLNGLKTNPTTKNFAKTLNKADSFYYENLGLPLRAEGMLYINTRDFNKDVTSAIATDTQKARDYLGFVGVAEGKPVLRHAIRLKAEKAVVDPATGNINPQKLKNFLANKTNKELIDMAKMNKEFSDIGTATRTITQSRQSHMKMHDEAVNKLSNGFFKVLTEKNTGEAVRSMMKNPRQRKELMAEIESLPVKEKKIVLAGLRNAFITEGMKGNEPLVKFFGKNQAATKDFFGEKYLDDLTRLGKTFDIVREQSVIIQKSMGIDPSFDAMQQYLGLSAAEGIGLLRNQILSPQRKVINGMSKIFLEKSRQHYYELSASMLKDPKVLADLANPPPSAVKATMQIGKALSAGKNLSGELWSKSIVPYYMRVMNDYLQTAPARLAPAVNAMEQQEQEQETN